MAEILRVDSTRPDPAVITRAAQCLRAGGLVAFPTETVYGLGVDATQASAVARVFAVKGRPASDPLIVHVPDMAAVRQVARELSATAESLARAFWPGPLTLVVPRNRRIVDGVTAGLDTVGIRMPSHPVALALATAAGVPIAAPSANLFSRPSPTRAEHVAEDLGNLIDIILDAGPTTVGVESTVVDVTTEPPCILRPGGVSLENLRGIVPDVVSPEPNVTTGAAQRAPGQLERHYSPVTPLTLFEGRDAVPRLVAALGEPPHDSAAILGTTGDLRAVTVLHGSHSSGRQLVCVDLGSEHDPAGVASRLYASLRECDKLGVSRVLALQPPGTTGVFDAIRDRLRRAAAGRVIR